MLDYTTDVRETWEQLDFEVDRVIDAGGDAIVVFWREIGRASHGHLEVETETAVIFKVRNGRIAEARGYLDRDEALRAAGLAG